MDIQAVVPARTAEIVSLEDFDAVYEAFYQQVFRAIRSMVLDRSFAEDITQNAFLKAYRNRGRYQPTGSLGGWLHRIAVREAISALRWHGVHERLVNALRLRPAPPAKDPTERDALGQLLAALSPGTRAAVVLFYYHGYRYREVAEILGIPEGTVATRIAGGLRKMRRLLDGV